MPFKANAAGRHHIPKQTRKVINWAILFVGVGPVVDGKFASTITGQRRTQEIRSKIRPLKTFAFLLRNLAA